MSRFCGKIVTICESDDMFNWYRIREENDSHIRYNNNMIEGLADEPQEKMVSLDKVVDKFRRFIIDYFPNLFPTGEEVKYVTDLFRKRLED